MTRAMKDSCIDWIGEIPVDWSLAELKRFVSVHNGKEILSEVNSSDDRAYPVYGSGGIFKYTDNYLYSGIAVMFGRKGTLGKPLYVEGAFWTVDTMYYLTYMENLDPKFNYFQLIVFDWNPYITQTALPSVVASQIVGCRFPIPLINEQKAIVNLLNQKCALIDTIADKTRASIEEYKRLRKSIITQAVTKGVRGNRAMKDSGIEWIGNIPDTWDVTRIKNIFTLRDERNDLPLHEVNLLSLYTDIGVVQHTDLEKTTGNKATNADGYKIVYENDIVVNIILCWMGAIGRSAYDGVTSPAYDIYTPSPNIECEYYHHYFRTSGFSGDCFKRGRGIMLMRWRTYSEQFREIYVPCPPLEEQKEIIAYLNAKCSEIDNLIKQKERLTHELESYKKSLIYEYVTGKKEVTS